MYDQDSYALYCFFFIQEQKQKGAGTSLIDRSLVSACEAYLADNLQNNHKNIKEVCYE
jgi:hypothetical protein